MNSTSSTWSALCPLEASTCVFNITSHSSILDITENHVRDITQMPFRTLFFNCMDFITVIFVLLLVFGITANILNIVVFAKTGVRDNITVSFLALSTSDLLYLIVLSPHIIIVNLIHFTQIRLGISVTWLFDPNILRYPFYWYAFVFYETSILINVYISVVRCACVAIPFKVKSTFTVRGAIIAFITFFVSAFLLRVPMFMKKQIVREFDPFNNKTRVVYKEAEDGGLAEKMNDIVSRNILNWASFVTVIACLIVMVTKLKASVRFRSSNAQHNSQPHATAINSAEIQNVQSNIPELTQSKTAERSLCDKWVSTSTMAHIQSDQSHLPEKIKEESKNQKPKKVSYPQTNQIKSAKNKSLTPDQGQHKVVATKETQVVRSVILVAAIFVTCQTPLMVYTLARRFESQFDDQDDKDSKNLQKYIFLYVLCSNISKIFAMVNASVNIFIYYNFNSRYRQCLNNLWK